MRTVPADIEAVGLDALLGRAQAGDRSAAQAAFALLWPPTVAYASALERRHGETGRAEDIAQEALVKLFQRLSDFDPERSGLGWALSLTYWEWLSSRTAARRRREEPLPTDREDLPAPGEDAESTLAAAEHLAVVTRLVERLSPDERKVLGLEAALGRLELLGPAALRKRRQRVLDRLRRAFQELTR